MILVCKDGNPRKAWDDFIQYFQPLSRNLRGIRTHSRCVSGVGQVIDDPGAYWIGNTPHNHWDRSVEASNRWKCFRGSRNYDVHLEAKQLGGQIRKPILVASSITGFDDDVLSFRIA